jgi:hypothetical protein
MLKVANAVVRRIANLAYSFPFTRPLRRGSLLKKVLPGGQVHLSRCSWTPWKAGTAGFGPSESGAGGHKPLNVLPRGRHQGF